LNGLRSSRPEWETASLIDLEWYPMENASLTFRISTRARDAALESLCDMNQEPETINQKLETTNQKPETRDLCS